MRWIGRLLDGDDCDAVTASTTRIPHRRQVGRLSLERRTSCQIGMPTMNV